MSYTRVWSRPWAVSCLRALVLLSFSAWTQALTVTYCSPDNIARTRSTTSDYMSNGLCQDICKSSYAFAIILRKECWCSNYAPGSTVSNSQCSDACPGYPSETCGNEAQGLYAYFQVGGSASGTIGGSSSSAARTSSSSFPPSSVSTTTLATVIITGSSSTGRTRSSWTSSSVFNPVLTSDVIPQNTVESSSSSSVASTSTTAAPTSSSEQTQVYTSVISVTGRVSTIIITPTPSQTSDSALGAGAQATNGGGGGGISGGTVAGIVVGVAIAIGLVIGGLVFLLLRKRHGREVDTISEAGGYASPSHASKKSGGIPSRQVSQMSSAGLLTRPSRVQTAGFSAAESAAAGTVNSDRNSTHMTVDQRLNPWAIYSNDDSRASNVSLHDNQDYSRQLRVANPDPQHTQDR